MAVEEESETQLTLEAFNRDWLDPELALEALQGSYRDPYTRKKWIMDRLKSGLILAVARTVEFGGEHFELAGIAASNFKRFGAYGDDHFWETGDHAFRIGRDGEQLQAFDIRLDPDSFNGRPPRIKPVEAMPLAPRKGLLIGGSPKEPEAPHRGKDISKDDAQRFSRAMVAGWPEATEQFAYSKALAFFPENKVPRDWFLGIYRSIRGPKNRGKQPKDRD
jgi:hypothetical protein